MISPITNSKNTRFAVEYNADRPTWTTHSNRRAALRHAEINGKDVQVMTFRQMVKAGYMNERGQVTV